MYMFICNMCNHVICQGVGVHIHVHVCVCRVLLCYRHPAQSQLSVLVIYIDRPPDSACSNSNPCSLHSMHKQHRLPLHAEKMSTIWYKMSIMSVDTYTTSAVQFMHQCRVPVMVVYICFQLQQISKFPQNFLGFELLLQHGIPSSVRPLSVIVHDITSPLVIPVPPLSFV